MVLHAGMIGHALTEFKIEILKLPLILLLPGGWISIGD